jgi:hypothetical protein
MWRVFIADKPFKISRLPIPVGDVWSQCKIHAQSVHDQISGRLHWRQTIAMCVKTAVFMGLIAADFTIPRRRARSLRRSSTSTGPVEQSALATTFFALSRRRQQVWFRWRTGSGLGRS